MSSRRVVVGILTLFTALAGACGSHGSATPDATPPDALPTILGGARPVTLQVPPDIQPGQRYPLVMILHGYSATGAVQQIYFEMRDWAKQKNVFVLAPDGTVDSTGNEFWNADPVCCDMDHTGVDDVAYLGGLLDTVIAERPIDPTRVFVLGHSNGGFMAFRMACDRADVISAIFDLAGAAASTASTCNPVRPVPILHMHGTADDMVPYDGATVGTLHMPSAVESVAQWATHDGCTGALTPGETIDLEESLPGNETQENSTAGCPPTAAADLWTVNGGSHEPELVPTFADDVWTWLDAHAHS